MERRYLQLDSPLELRSEDGKDVLVGMAAVFYRAGDEGTEYELWKDVLERIASGAFDRALKERHDVAGLLNHNPDNLLGRSTSGTLRLSKTKEGLRYEIDLPDTTAGRDTKESLSRGDLNGSSFAFRVTGEKWETDGDLEIRTITDVDLRDVGPVVYPAYTATSAGLRSEDVAECRDSLAGWQEHKRLDRCKREAEWEHDLNQATLAGL